MLSPDDDLKQVEIPKELPVLHREGAVPNWLELGLLLKSSIEPFLLSLPNPSLLTVLSFRIFM